MTGQNAPNTLQPLPRACARLASAELWVVGGVVSASIVFPQLLLAAVLTAAFFWPLRRLAYGRWSVRTPGDFAILLMLLMAAISWWVTPLPQVTQPQVYRLLSGIVLYYTIANTCQGRRSLYLLLWIFSLGGLCLALLAPLSVDWPLGKLVFIPDALYSQFSILVADSVHPNVIAGALALLLPATLAGLLFGWRALTWVERAIGLLCAASMSTILALSLSRGAWVAVGLAGLALVVMRWRRGWVIAMLSLCTAAVVVYWFGPQQALEALVASKTVGSLVGRLEVWNRAGNMILDFPFTGIGMGVFQPLADRLYPFLIFEPGQVHHAHNLLLQVAVDLGIPGLLAWLWMLVVGVSSAGQAYRMGRAENDALLTAVGAGLLSSQIALVFHGLTDAVTWGMVRSAPLVWALWGAAVAARVYWASQAGQPARRGGSKTRS